VDSVPKKGGRPPGPLITVAIAAVALFGGISVALWASTGGGYDEVQRLASVKCLGCLGLDPRVPGFSEFWTVYPGGHIKAGQEVPHPALVRDILNESGTDLLIIFYWTQGCVPCAEQWEEMVGHGIAEGTEEDGKEGPEYSNMKLLSVDAAEDMELYRTYRPKGTENGVPMTVFLFEKDGDVNWYSHYGKMELKDVDGMINNILYHEISSAHGP
jgi:hypothetical protein